MYIMMNSELNHDLSSLTGSASAVAYHHESQRVFVGLGTGVIYVSYINCFIIVITCCSNVHVLIP